MLQPSGKPIYIPPFSGVRLIECREHFQLVPVPAVRTTYGYGKIKAREAKVNADEFNPVQFWTDLKPEDEIWCIMQWFVYEDGHQESGNISFMRPECTEDEAKESMERMMRHGDFTREQALGLLQCYDATEEDHQFVEDNYPNYQTEPDSGKSDEYDVYHARLKVMAELSPETVKLLKIANSTKDPEKRKYVERETVQSFFAEWAHYFTEDEILAWQKSNPVGTGWMCEFAEVMKNPRRQIDPINHELALNWLRQKYNEMTAKTLADAVYKRVWRWVTDQINFSADFIKKRRERLGLTTKRKPGAPEK